MKRSGIEVNPMIEQHASLQGRNPESSESQGRGKHPIHDRLGWRPRARRCKTYGSSKVGVLAALCITRHCLKLFYCHYRLTWIVNLLNRLSFNLIGPDPAPRDRKCGLWRQRIGAQQFKQQNEDLRNGSATRAPQRRVRRRRTIHPRGNAHNRTKRQRAGTHMAKHRRSGAPRARARYEHVEPLAFIGCPHAQAC